MQTVLLLHYQISFEDSNFVSTNNTSASDTMQNTVSGLNFSPFLTRPPRSLTVPSTSSFLLVACISLSLSSKSCFVDWTRLVSVQTQQTTCCSACWRSQVLCNSGRPSVLLFHTQFDQCVLFNEIVTVFVLVVFFLLLLVVPKLPRDQRLECASHGCWPLLNLPQLKKLKCDTASTVSKQLHDRLNVTQTHIPALTCKHKYIKTSVIGVWLSMCRSIVRVAPPSPSSKKDSAESTLSCDWTKSYWLLLLNSRIVCGSGLGNPCRPRSGARQSAFSEVRGKAIHVVWGQGRFIPRRQRSGARSP